LRFARVPAVVAARALTGGMMRVVAQRTRYARNGDVNIAYQIVGDGPVDLMVVPGFVSNLDLTWIDRSWPRSGAAWRRFRG
jgi:hypothetical protein